MLLGNMLLRLSTLYVPLTFSLLFGETLPRSVNKHVWMFICSVNQTFTQARTHFLCDSYLYNICYIFPPLRIARDCMWLQSENISFVLRADSYFGSPLHHSLSSMPIIVSHFAKCKHSSSPNKSRIKVLNLPSQKKVVRKKKCAHLMVLYKIYHSFSFVLRIKASTHSHSRMWNLALTTWIRNVHKPASQDQSSKL